MFGVSQCPRRPTKLWRARAQSFPRWSWTDLLSLGPCEDAVKLGPPGDGHVLDLASHRAGPSVPRGDEHLVDERRLGELPGESMLSASSTEKQDPTQCKDRRQLGPDTEWLVV